MQGYRFGVSNAKGAYQADGADEIILLAEGVHCIMGDMQALPHFLEAGTPWDVGLRLLPQQLLPCRHAVPDINCMPRSDTIADTIATAHAGIDLGMH